MVDLKQSLSLLKLNYSNVFWNKGRNNFLTITERKSFYKTIYLKLFLIDKKFWDLLTNIWIRIHFQMFIYITIQLFLSYEIYSNKFHLARLV